MAHVAIDVFAMPPIKQDGKPFDCVVVCVDRHSGWLIVVPEFQTGLTGATVAKALIKQWSIFGIPTKITSDHGPHFDNAWWRHMCAHLGITHMYSQPYHHQANGRAERAGQQLIEVLRKLIADTRHNWLELLPRAINIIHDTPGESGLSPYQILFGRERYTANIPYIPPRECLDAQEFFQVMEEQDALVARKMNEMHDLEAACISAKRKEMEPFPIGTKVWYRRPEGSGNKLDTRWVGPGQVLSRDGDGSYLISTGPNSEISATRSYLKEYREDAFNERPVPLFFHKRTVRFAKEPPPTKLAVQDILDHYIDSEGNYTFLVQRVGEDRSNADTIPASDFLDKIALQLMEYCKKNDLEGALGIFRP
jgi:hypothetical protein